MCVFGFCCCCCCFRYGKWYVKVMTNVIKKGDEYISTEFTRLLRMLYDEADSLKDEKLAEFRQRITVLKVRDLAPCWAPSPPSPQQLPLLFPLPFLSSQDGLFRIG